MCCYRNRLPIHSYQILSTSVPITGSEGQQLVDSVETVICCYAIFNFIDKNELKVEVCNVSIYIFNFEYEINYSLTI